MPPPISSGSGIRSGSMDCSQAIQDDGCLPASIASMAVVAPHEPVVASCRNIFLVQAAISPGNSRPLTTVQMLKVQLHQVRIVEISREIVTGTGTAAHVADGVSHFRRQAFDMFRIQGIVVQNLAAACEHCSIVIKAKKHNCSRNRRPYEECPHASFSVAETMH